MKRKLLLSVFVFVLGLSLVCSGAFAAAKKGKIKLAYPSPYVGQEFWSEVKRGIEETAASMPNVEMTVVTSHEDATTQMSQVESFIAAKVDAILLAPTDFTALTPAVEEANKAGIPVIGVDAATAGGKLETLVASNNISVGKAAGEYIAKALGGKGKVILGDYSRHSSCRARSDGFREALKKYPGIKIIHTLDVKLMPETTDQAENVLTAFPDFDAYFSCADVISVPFYKVAKERGRGEKIIFVGVDASDDGLAAVEEGLGYRATIAQQPYLMGKMAVEAAIKVLNGQKLEKFTEVPVILVTKDNLEKFRSEKP